MRDTRSLIKKYLKKAESENKSLVNYNTFLNTVLPVIDKIKRNREEVNVDVFEYFIGTDIGAAKEVSGYADSAAAAGGSVFMLAKKIYDKVFFSLPSLADLWKNSLIDDELEKDGLLDEEDSESTDINEILDMAANAAAEAVADSLDFVNIDGAASSVSRNLYSSAKKEAKEEVEKKIVNETKDTVSKVGKQVLKKEINRINKEDLENKVIAIANQIKSNNGTPPKGYKGGRIYNNKPKSGDQKLPENINYKEYDINPYIKGQNRGLERIVIGDDGSVWYTDNHYHTFTKIE